MGTGQDVQGAMGGKDEYRCDMISTPSKNLGICMVAAGTPAGHYNFTYHLEDAGTGKGFGFNIRKGFAAQKVSLTGKFHDVEIYPTVYGLSHNRVGRLGGAEIVVEADAL